jgi:hypothetical protein
MRRHQCHVPQHLVRIGVVTASKALRKRLFRVETEAAEGISLDLDSDPAAPVAIAFRATRQAEANLVASKRHPVDAAITQSIVYHGHGLP